MRKIAIILVLSVVGSVQAQPAVKSKAFADTWRAKAKTEIGEADNNFQSAGGYRLKLVEDVKKLEDELDLRKAAMPIEEYTRGMKIASVARQNAKTALDQLVKASTALTKANKFITASDNQYALGLWMASGNKAVEASIDANISITHSDRSIEIIDIGYDRWKMIDDILKKYRPIPSGDN